MRVRAREALRFAAGLYGASTREAMCFAAGRGDFFSARVAADNVVVSCLALLGIS